MRRLFLRVLAALLVVAVALAVLSVVRKRRRASLVAESVPTARVAAPLSVALTIYDRKLSPDWEDWSRGRHETPTYGPAKFMFGDFGAFVLRHSELAARFGGLSFRYQAPAEWEEFLSASLKRASPGDPLPEVAIQPRHVVTLPDGWREVLVEWRELNPLNIPFDRVAITARTKVPDRWILLDKLVLTKPDSPRAAGHLAERGVSLGISCRILGPRINPLIYGAANGDPTSGFSAVRIGGNPVSRLNWDINAWNVGKDWFFENQAGIDVRATVAHNATLGMPTALVVPLIGWVAKDKTSVGFPSSKFQKQQKFDPKRPEAGNGQHPDGAPITPGAPTQTSVAAPPELIGRWIKSLRQSAQGSAGHQSRMYILDNEPSLWDATHRDVHPEPLGYDDLLDRTLRYATEIRRADPDARIAGPAEWGWTGYFFSAKDRAAGVSSRPDRTAHGGVPLLPWYLRKLAEHEKESGVTLLDVLDVHFYPAGDGLYDSKAPIDADNAARRIRATRALWDPSYEDESWIQEPVRLIPRLKEWVSVNYPGRWVSIGEWSFGGDDHISGALATAEALGRFGQQGLDSAYYWDGPKAGTKTFWAFRAFRNFDGDGGHFLEQSLGTRESEGVSLFASRNDAHDNIVAVLVNKDADFRINAEIEFEACGPLASHRVFGYDAGSSEIVGKPTQKQHTSLLTTTLPPYSITVLDIHLESGP